MLFITKKLINRLSEPHREPDMLACYATPQSFSARTSRAILLISQDRVIILYLNLFSTRVVQKVEYEVAELEDQKYKDASLSAAGWSFSIKGQRCRFRIMKVILPLGSMQRDFLDFVERNILD